MNLIFSSSPRERGLPPSFKPRQKVSKCLATQKEVIFLSLLFSLCVVSHETFYNFGTRHGHAVAAE